MVFFSRVAFFQWPSLVLFFSTVPTPIHLFTFSSNLPSLIPTLHPYNLITLLPYSTLVYEKKDTTKKNTGRYLTSHDNKTVSFPYQAAGVFTFDR